MRTYNPALSTYKTIKKQVEKMSHVKEPTRQLSGLLAPMKKQGQETDNINGPFIKVAKHFKILNDKRNQINGS